MTMIFCRRCLYSTAHPLGLEIDDSGICSGCRVHEEKNLLDWDTRWEKLEKLVQPYRNRTGSNYDCIIPVTGANDSYWIVHLVKEKLGLNPLLVTYNKYYNTPLGIRNLANLRIVFNCDIIVQNVNPQTVRKITRSTLRRFGSVYWHVLAGQTVFPVQTAVRYQIPLIIWGAHQGLEQVGQFSHQHEVEMTRRYRKDHDLMGKEADDLLNIFDTLKEEDIWQYRYPEDAALNAVGVRGIYLGNYTRWDPKIQHENMKKERGYETSLFNRTFDCYDHVDCFTYMGLHDLLKLYKHGYSKVTDHASREIRFGRITRNQGIALVKKFEQQKPLYLDLFSKWIGSDMRGMQFILDQHRNPLYWNQLTPGNWEFNGWSKNHHDVEINEPEGLFSANSTLERGRGTEYIIIGKGWQ
jgi:N-acetyl sugar amidotransferase